MKNTISFVKEEIIDDSNSGISERWWEEKSRLQGLRRDWEIINTSKECGEILDRGIWHQTRFLSFRIRNTSYVYRLGGNNPLGEKRIRGKEREKKGKKNKGKRKDDYKKSLRAVGGANHTDGVSKCKKFLFTIETGGK